MYDLEELKARINIVDLAGELGLDPRRVGANYFARCPSHNDQGRPNLALHAKKGAKCFRCGYGADVIKLAADVKFHGDKGEAIKYLASRAGLTSRPSTSRSSDPWEAADQVKQRPAQKVKVEQLPKGAPLPAPQAAPAPAEDGKEGWATMTVTWPLTLAKVPAVEEWRRLEDGRIETTYTPEGLVRVMAYYEFELTADEAAAMTPEGLAWALSWAVDCDLKPEQVKTACPDRPTLRVRVYEALLYQYCHPAGFPSPGAIWLTEQKGIEPMTQAGFGIAWLDWEQASKALPQLFGVEALDSLGLMTKDRKTGKPIELRFKNHRLIFPFWLTQNGRRFPVYAQGRNVNTKEKQGRFDNASGPVPCPYNFDAVMKARETGKPVFICEGATDTLTLAQAGFLSCGIVGTQGFKPEWVKHFDGLEVYLATDPDEPGKEAAQKIARVFVNQGRPSPKIVPLPQGQDVTDFFTGKASKKTN